MSRAYPYRRPPSDVIRPGPWTLATHDGAVPLPSEMPSWDYNTTLSLHRQVMVDGLRARLEAGLGTDADLILTVGWTASGSLLRGRAWQESVPTADDADLTVEFDLGGHELGGMLELSLVLTLAAAGVVSVPTAPRRPGSRLWSDRFLMLLQGESNLFPVAVADFGGLPYAEEAAWYLEIGDDLEAAALGSLLLLVNERRRPVVDALTRASDPSETDAAVLSLLHADVLRSLVERAVTADDFDTDGDHAPESLGALLVAVLRRWFPDVDLETLRRERKQDPASFAGRVQAAARVLADSR